MSTGGSVGVANPSVGGSSGLENQYVVDGVNITNGGYGALGSYFDRVRFARQGTPYDFMQEVQVKTGGYEAEFGQATGGVINVVTKSGSNAFRGSAFAYVRPHSLESALQYRPEHRGNRQHRRIAIERRRRHVGRTWACTTVCFFRRRSIPSGRRQPSLRRKAFHSMRSATSIATGASRTMRQREPGRSRRRHRFDASVFGDPATGPAGPQRSSALLNQTTSAYSSLEYGGHNQIVHYDGVLNRHFLVDASFGRALNRILETPAVNDWQIRDLRVTPRGSYRAVSASMKPATAATTGRSRPRRRTISVRAWRTSGALRF